MPQKGTTLRGKMNAGGTLAGSSASTKRMRRDTGKCTNGCTMLLLSPYYPPTMVRLNSAQRNECINWHAAWLNRQKAYSEADRSSNARKENKQRKKEAKKENKKRKVSLFRFVLYKTHENNKRKETKRNEKKRNETTKLFNY